MVTPVAGDKQVKQLGGKGAGEGYGTPGSAADGMAYSYDEQGWIVRGALYRDGLLQGEERLYGDAGDPLFVLPQEAAAGLEHNQLSADLRQAFAGHGVQLFDDALVETADPGREYLVTQTDRSYTARLVGDRLEVYTGRLVQKSCYQDNCLTSRDRYKGGCMEGEAATYGPPGPPLFSLDMTFQSALNAGPVEKLQPAFAKNGQVLAADAIIAAEVEGVEWRITQSGKMLSVLNTGGALAVYPGRITWRGVFAGGWAMQTATYREGLLDGDSTAYKQAGDELFSIDRNLSADLDAGRTDALLPLFEQQGHALSAGAALSPVTEGLEWFVKQIGRTYTVRRVGDRLGVFGGRVAAQTGYKGGQQEGTTTLYDKGAIAGVISFHAGLLDGPMTLYAGSLPTSLLTFQGGKKHGPAITYDEQGRPALVSQYQGGLLDGETWIYKGGNKQAMTTYRVDKKDGPSVAYYPGGQEHLVAQYKAGLRDGESLVYGEDGQIVQKSNYKADLLDGESLLYDHDGHLVKQASYRAGKLQGESIDYFPSGVTRKRAHYRDGKLDGVVFLYADNGRVKEVRYYRNGQQVGEPERPSWRQTLFER